MSEYKPLSVRRGLREELKAQEGVPPQLRYAVRKWLESRFGFHSSGGMNDGLMASVAITTGIHVQATYDTGGIMNQILGACEADDDVYLDVLDATLHFVGSSAAASGLKTVLDMGGSAWTVASDGKSLQRRVDPTATQAVAAAADPADKASEELKEAWASAYGRTPNPSDAWDHSIKAVEEVLIPVVVPKVQKATLGDVLGQLKANPTGWKFLLGTSSTTLDSVQTLEAMLRMMWPNPDRHGGGKTARTPTPDEAAAVVQLAVLVVQWCRNGGLSKR